MLRLDGRLALVRGLLRPSSELSGAGSRGADRLVGRKVERDAAEPRQRGRGWDRERRPRSESPSDGKAGRRGATAFERRAGEQNAAPPCASFCSNFTGTSMRQLCCPTKPLRIGSFHDQFRYSPEQVFLGSVLLRSSPPQRLSPARPSMSVSTVTLSARLAAKLAPGFWSSVSSHSIGFIS